MPCDARGECDCWSMSKHVLATEPMRAITRRLTPPPHTRLILASEDILEHWGTRTEDGRRIIVQWGEQKPEGWYEPIFRTEDDGFVRDAAVGRAAMAWGAAERHLASMSDDDDEAWHDAMDMGVDALNNLRAAIAAALGEDDV
jgi:hypothetical protein